MSAIEKGPTLGAAYDRYSAASVALTQAGQAIDGTTLLQDERVAALDQAAFEFHEAALDLVGLVELVAIGLVEDEDQEGDE